MTDLSFYEKIKDLCYIRRQLPEVITRREFFQGEECFLIFDDVKKGFYKLKGNAWKIWEMLDGEKSMESIVEQIQAERWEQRDVVVSDVCKFVSKLGRKGLIKAAVKRV